MWLIDCPNGYLRQFQNKTPCQDTLIMPSVCSSAFQNRSIKFMRTVHMRAFLPYMYLHSEGRKGQQMFRPKGYTHQHAYIGIVVNKHATCIPPIATNTNLLPSASNHRLKNKLKTKPWRTFFEKLSVTSASPAY